MSNVEIPKAYEPKQVEDKWYAEWLAKGCFTANPASAKPPYSIVIPPPNVTGVLTMGHVLNNTLQDILARRKRMQGYEVLWLPGTDHAGIATQTVVEKTLRKQKVIKHRDDLGREKFLEKVWEWKDKHGGIIIQQLKKLGCSCDWSRERFTMDEGYSQAVLRVFVDLYKKGLIYRGKRMVNWCPVSRTALSDEEVIMKEVEGHLWHIKYPLVGRVTSRGDSADAASGDAAYIVVATTRPETMLGDEAVAVNPEDPRYQHLIGKKLLLPLKDKQIPIIADAAVDPKFGTGCVKVTPAHDVADYEIALRHKLPFTVVIGPDGTMTEEAGEMFEGLDRMEAREAVVKELQEDGLLLKVEPYHHNVGYSERADVPIEPYLSEQWFLKYPQVPRSIAAVETGEITFFPERWAKTYNHWMTGIKDWCISRQLWWGHRIPVWYRKDVGRVTSRGAASGDAAYNDIHVGIEPPPDPENWTQDSDVLDTWFSSWLWPFATMDDATRKKFYPTTDLVTGPDIIFFWVARMIMAGYEFQGQKPFSNVYYTGIIRDAIGRKMSKSLGNSPDPLDLIAKYGADGLRFGLMLIAPQGQDILFDEKRCEVGRNFMNKLWNAARFIQMQRAANPPSRPLNAHDNRVLWELNEAITKISYALETYRFSEAAKELYDFVWGDFCDWYIEASKVSANIAVLDDILNTILRLLHPFAPFITEELWNGEGSIQFAPWPRVKATNISLVVETQALYAAVTAGRQLRSDNGVDPKKKIQFVIKPGKYAEFFRSETPFLAGILNAESVAIDEQYTPTGLTPSLVTTDATIFLVGAVDPAAERQKLTKQLADIEKQIAGTEAKLANENFVQRAAPIAVQREREKLATLREQRDKVTVLLRAL
ncbi:MAG: valine--tRNA ligase [Verrucomicrobia bacterium]|nr:valine--tRNA ligase [Verrucomicrobiota bacterium]